MELFQTLLIVIIQNVELKSIFSDPVTSCPKNEKEWNDSSLLLKCNDTHSYHCSPYLTNHTVYQLYEFCYRSINVSKDNCLVLRGDGHLNEYDCRNFLSGCPSVDYNSNKLHKYQKCLGVQDDCFTEDSYCICTNEKNKNTTAISQSETSRLNEKTTKPTGVSTSGQNTSDQHQELYFIFLVISICLCVPSLVFNFLLVLRIRSFKDLEMLKCCTTKSRRGLGTDESAEENLQLVPLSIEIDRTPVSDRQQSSRFEPDDIFRMTLVDFTIEDEQLFNLLKRQCLHGVYSEFEYLMRTRVKKSDKEYIFKQRDKNGCILLHYAAQGGNTIIFDDILVILEKKCPNVNFLEEKCIRGQCALHFAIKHQHKNMIDHIIKLHSDKKNQNAESTATQQESEFDTVRGEFSPVHLAAWFGDTRLLTTLMKNGFEINRKTRNGLNILDIACMKQLCGESETEFQFCEHLIINNLLKPNDLSKTDMSGWNIAHYASLSNFKLFKYIASHDEVRELVMVKTKASKTCLHIACEFGKTEIVGFIAGHFTLKKLIPEKDKLGWNALHFAAKGGELKILEFLLKIEGMEIDSKTDDGKTLLHIACIHKKTEICKFLIKQFGKNKDKYKVLLNIKTTNNKLTAAHYLAVEKKEDGSEREILKMLINTKQVDFSAINGSGLTVLEFAVNHLNKELIECILSATYREVFQINAKILEKCKKYANDDSIKQILERTISEINSLNT